MTKQLLIKQFLIAVLLPIIIFLFLLPFITNTHRLLDPIAQERLKEGKTFWNWRTPHGTYAVHYIEKGQGDKHIFLIHGFRAHTYTWRYLIDPLAEAGFHVWAIDLLGFGLSDKPIGIPYDMDFFVQQLQDFLQDHDIQKTHVVGNSLGGGLSLELAVACPQRVKSLSLITALGYPLKLNWYLILGKTMGHLMGPLLNPTIIRKGLEEVMYDKSLITDEQVQAYSMPYRFPGGTSASISVLGNFDNGRLERLCTKYENMHCPVLVIWGENDSVIPLSHYQCFIRDFPHAKKVVIPNCGHIPQEENPKQVEKTMVEFLNGIDY